MSIEIKNLSKIYPRGKKKALDRVNITIPTGIFGLIGRNGAGKSTLMRIIATVMDASEGEILIDGKPLLGKKDDFRSSLGYLPQNSKLMPNLNIVEFLDYVCVMKRIKNKNERKTIITDLIEAVGLKGEEKKLLGRYSGGMLRRAGIAQILVGEPKVLIIDEPTAGLDPEERLFFLNMLSRIAYGRTIIFSTHITADIEHLCRNICVLDMGQVKYLGLRDEFIGRIDGRLWEHTNVTGEEEGMIRKNGIVTSVSFVDGKPIMRYVSDKSLAYGSQMIKATLEDAYIFSLGGAKR